MGTKSFVQYSQAWYAKSPNQPQRDWHDEVLIMFTDEDGHIFEIPFRWYMLGNVRSVIRLEVFSGCMEYIEQIQDVIALADKKHYSPTPNVFCEQLKEWGYKDETKYERVNS